MITKIPDPVLTIPAKTVVNIDKKILGLISQMKKDLINSNNPKGVGLAAPQIGVSLRIFITRPTEKSAIGAFINPEITAKSKEISEINRIVENANSNIAHEKKLEGCLSIPNVWGYLKRSTTVRLRFMNLDGQYKEAEFKGFMATIVQHETDHVNGILFTQRVLEQNQKLYRIEKNEKGEEKLIEIEI